MLMTLPGESDKTNNGVFPCITYGGTEPIYASRGDIIGLSGEIANLSNEVTNLSGYVYNIQVDPSSWSLYPAVSFVDLSQNAISNCSRIEIDEQILTADASDLLLNGIPIATITSISNVADWALFPAISNVNVSNFALQNVSGLQLDGTAISTDGLFIYANGSNGVERWAQFPATTLVNMSGSNIQNADQIDASGISCVDAFINTLYVYTPDNNSSAVVTSDNSGRTLLLNTIPILTSADISANVGTWANFPAVTNVDMSGFAISNTPSVSISGNTQNVVLTASGTELLVDGQPVYTGSLPPSDVANWANYPAVANVNMSGFAIQSTTDLSLTSGGSIYLASTSNIKVQTKMETGSIEMTGLLSQTFAGSGCNFFGSAVQVGTNGVLPTDNFGSANIYGGNIPVGLSTLYVQGGTTLDGGGTVHGITIGTLPVAGINTQRIDVLPVGIEMTTPTFITMNGLGAANIAMGGAIAIAAGSYVTLEHGIGLGQNGIFLQNSGRGDGCRVIFTGGGTLYNATQVQATEIVNPTGVQFWNGVFNPSGGAVIAPPVYGRAVVDISTQNCFFASLTSGAIPTQNATSNSVYIGQLAGMTLSGGNSSIVIGDNNRMFNQGREAIAIGVDSGAANMGNNAIALGYGCGVQSMGDNSIGIGTFAGSNSLGSNSVAIGANAGQLGIGVNSVVVGANAGSNATGSNSVAIGAGASRSGAGTYTTSVGYNACSNNLGSNSIAIGALSANGGMGEFSTYIGTCFTTEGAVPTKTIVLNNTGTALNPTNSNAFYVGKLTQVASSAGFNMTAHNNGTGEFIQTLTSSLSLDSTISNTQRISYDTGLLTTQVDGLLKVAGSAEFTQSVTCDTTLNVLGLTTLSSLVIQNISAGASAKSVYYNPSLGILTQADAPINKPFSYNLYVSAVSGDDTTGTGQINNPYKTIGAAVAYANTISDANPVIINLACGTYTENVTITRDNTYITGGSTSLSSSTIINGIITYDMTGSSQSIIVGGISSLQIYGFAVNNASPKNQSIVITDCIIAPGTAGVYCVVGTDTSVGGFCDITIQNSIMYILDTAAMSLSSVSATLINSQITTNPLVGNVNVSFVITKGNGRINLFGSTLIQPSTSSAVLPLIDLQNTTNTPTTMTFNSAVLQYTSATSDAGTLGKACIRFSNGAGITMGVSAANPSVSMYGCFLLCQGATTTNGSAGQFVAIQKAAGGGTAYFNFGTNNMCGATANHISQNLTRTSWVALTT
jgi:hypothetical protein